MAARESTHRDPYYRCELHCTHDLGFGMSIAELLGPGEPPPRPRKRRSSAVELTGGGRLLRPAADGS